MATESYDPSYYEVLGVPEDASATHIGRAFMRAMRDAHPDAHAADDAPRRAAAESRARLLTEAHGVLTGPDRTGYDERLRAARGPVRPPVVGTDDLFDDDGPDEPVLPHGVPDGVVLRLTRERWLRGGRLAPITGGRPIDVPARVGAGEALVYPGRGPLGPDGRPGDLQVRVVHVDSDGSEVPGGHVAATGAGRVGDVLRRMSPGDLALVALGVVVVLAAAAVLAAVT